MYQNRQSTAPSSLSERTNKVGQERDYQARFVHYRGAGRLWRPPTHPRWVRKRYFNHLSDKLLASSILVSCRSSHRIVGLLAQVERGWRQDKYSHHERQAS